MSDLPTSGIYLINHENPIISRDGRTVTYEAALIHLATPAGGEIFMHGTDMPSIVPPPEEITLTVSRGTHLSMRSHVTIATEMNRGDKVKLAIKPFGNGHAMPVYTRSGQKDLFSHRLGWIAGRVGWSIPPSRPGKKHTPITINVGRCPA